MFNKRAEEFRNLSVRPKDATNILEYLSLKGTIKSFVKKESKPRTAMSLFKNSFFQKP